jgi:glycosyltransferase involved in cell wall biosynthesis
LTPEPTPAPTFSVIIPTYGRAALLSEAIDSVLAQSFTDFECIVVDDASDDPPRLASDPRLALIVRDHNGGAAAARNTGIAAATGRFVAFLDDDDVWRPGRLAAAAEAHGRAPVVICWQSTLGAAAHRPSRTLEGDVRDTVLDGITPHLGATSIERRVAPAFDERFDANEDVEWWWRVAQELRVATASYVGLLYRVHAGPRARTGQQERIANARVFMAEQAEWFRTHPRAKAFRLKRLGLSALQVNDRALALRSFAASFRLAPEPATAWHALRTLVPRRSGRQP